MSILLTGHREAVPPKETNTGAVPRKETVSGAVRTKDASIPTAEALQETIHPITVSRARQDRKAQEHVPTHQRAEIFKLRTLTAAAAEAPAKNAIKTKDGPLNKTTIKRRNK